MKTRISLLNASILALLLFLLCPLLANAEAYNALSDEQYAEFGLTPVTTDEFINGTDPLEGYEPTVLAELYLGRMNAVGQDHYEGSFKVFNETSELDSDALSINASTRTLVGSETSLANYDKGFQTQNTCAVDVDGDGIDEIAELVLYTANKGDDEECQDRAVLSYYKLDGNTWKKTELNNWPLTATGSSYIQDIDANTSKSYCAITAGNFDNSEDGTQEIACYIARRGGSGAFISVYSPAAKSEKYTIELADISSRFDVTADVWTVSGTRMPVVGLATTSISGTDDLVVTVSNPLVSGYDQRSALVIYNMAAGILTTRYEDLKLTSSANHRMRFCSAVDADLLGDDNPVLVVGGYENYSFSDDTSAGKLSNLNNMVQIYTWDALTDSYVPVWGDPQDSEIAYGSKLALTTAMMEPAAMAAGRLRTSSAADRVFFEGSILRFVTSESASDSALDMLRAGSFSVEQKIATNGGNSAFISQAAIGHFSSSAYTSEQLVVLQGDENTFNGINDKIYYDLSWTYEENGQLKSYVVNNDFVESDQDDNGTYCSICLLNSDNDTVQVKYLGRDMGWSEPELYCILLSPPYWRELLYEDAGSVSFELSYGEMSGQDWTFNIGGGLFAEGETLAGAGFMGNEGEAGMAGEIGGMATIAHKHSYQDTSETRWRITVSPGENYAIMYAVPIVSYHYNVFIPEHVMTESEAENYALVKEPDEPDYQAGDTVPAAWEELDIVSEGPLSVSHITLDKYNELVQEMGDLTHLVQITDDMLPAMTIGDPSTYPADKTDLTARGNVDDLEISDVAAQVAAGSGETRLDYTTGYENEDETGFDLDFEGRIAFAGHVSVSFFGAGYSDFKVGIQAHIGGGHMWTGAKSHDWGFSSIFADLPEGTSSNYNFNSNMAVYQLDLPDTDDDPYCVAFTVSGINDDAVPPALPSEMRVFATTEDEVILRWEQSDYRAAQSWEVFIVDNNGLTQSLGVVNTPYFRATHLDPSTTYKFAIKSYTGPNGTGVASSLSAYVSATTKESSSIAPHFVERPTNEFVIIGAEEPVAFHAQASFGEGMEEQGATLSYQWQRFTADSLALEGTWEDIAGATEPDYVLPTITEVDGAYVGSDGNSYGRLTYYRLVVTQRLGANVHSIISRTAAMVVVTQDEYDDLSARIPAPSSEQADSALTLGFTADQGAAAVIKSACFFDPDEQVSLALTGTFAGAGETDSAGVTILLMCRDRYGERLLDQATTAEDGSFSFTVPAATLARASELYAICEGTTIDDAWDTLPAQSNSLAAYGVIHRSVNYNADGGMNTAYNLGMITSLSDTTALQPALRRGYTFTGWKNELGELVYSLGSADVEATSALTLTASYTANVYPISYELSGGVNAAENPSSYTVEDAVRLLDPTREGYVFVGWFLDAELTQATDGVPLNSIGPVTFYAAWEKSTPEPIDPEPVNPQPSGDNAPTNQGGNNGGREGIPATGEPSPAVPCALLAGLGLVLVAVTHRVKQHGYL